MKVLTESIKRSAGTREERRQAVDISASLQGRHGSFNRTVKTVQIVGTCRVTRSYMKPGHPGIEAEFGFVTHNHVQYVVVRELGDTDNWEAVDRRQS